MVSFLDRELVATAHVFMVFLIKVFFVIHSTLRE